MKRVDYQAYLRSPEWRTTRRLMLDQFGHRCQVCNDTELLQVHHRTYDRLGEERLTDLTVLCDACHAKHHDKLPKVPTLRVVKPEMPTQFGPIEFPTASELEADRRWRHRLAIDNEQTCHCCAHLRTAELKDAA